MMLSDIKTENLGRYEGKNKNLHHRGMLFDLDGLMKVGINTRFRWLTPGYIPPEIPQKNGKPLWQECVTSAKEMTYQFGKCLEEIIGLIPYHPNHPNLKSSFSIPDMYMAAIKSLAQEMTETDPAKRLSVRDAVEKLDNIIQVIKRDSQPYIQQAA